MTVCLTTVQNVDVAITVLDENGNVDPATLDAGSVVATLSPPTGTVAIVSADQSSVNIAPTVAGTYSLSVSGSVDGVALTPGTVSIVVTAPVAPVITATSIGLTPGTPSEDAPSVAPSTTEPGNNTATTVNPSTGEVIVS
jgi:hypothetical protein